MVTPTALATAGTLGVGTAATATTAAAAAPTLATLTQLASLGSAGAGIFSALKTKKPGEIPKAPQLEIAAPREAVSFKGPQGRTGLINTGPTGLPTKGKTVKRGLIGV